MVWGAWLVWESAEGLELGIEIGWTLDEPGHLKELVRPVRLPVVKLGWRERGEEFQSVGLNFESSGEAKEEAGEPERLASS